MITRSCTKYGRAVDKLNIVELHDYEYFANAIWLMMREYWRVCARLGMRLDIHGINLKYRG